MAKPALVGVRELKTRLGGYLQKVRRGQRLIVTDRGTPIAEIRPIEQDDSDEAAFERLIALGVVTPPTRALKAMRPVLDRDVGLADAIREDRDEGW